MTTSSRPVLGTVRRLPDPVVGLMAADGACLGGESPCAGALATARLVKMEALPPSPGTVHGGEPVTDLTLHYAVKGTTTVLLVRGTVDAARCHLLRDGLDMARELRQDGPVVVDLAGVDRLAAVAVQLLRETADATRHTRRPVSVRHLRSGTIDDPRSLLLLPTCTDPPSPAAPTHRRGA